MFAVLMHGRPPIGRSFFVFYFTGLMPYHFFVHISSGMTHAIPGNGSLLQLPLVTKFDVVLARGILEFVTDLLVALILLGRVLRAGLRGRARRLLERVPGACGGRRRSAAAPASSTR